MVDKTVFQGSMDGVSYTDIFTIEDTVLEGWNYVKWDSDKPDYRFYKF